ncbi:hypothetical protein Lalb_Chr01g0006381 [Lupinus albus]|uniref:Uncharacterized protein n=1 Tax=Lupinus albus TaxID=3870 RepID=A0A6A4R5D4_LUPAL|nr:hypothetical protein Lalb_Chr01g0006381 [Lupinus albus]
MILNHLNHFGKEGLDNSTLYRRMCIFLIYLLSCNYDTSIYFNLLPKFLSIHI